MKYPVITTRGVIVFPGYTSSLDVGRKSSLNAIDIAISKFNNQLVLVSQRDILKNEVGGKADLFSVGTLVSIKVEREHQTNAKTLAVTGLKRVRIKEISLNEGFLVEAEISVLKDRQSKTGDEGSLVTKISRKLDAVVGSMVNIPKHVLSSLASGISAGELADVIAHYLPIALPKKQEILEATLVSKRLKLILQHLEEESRINQIDKDIDKSVRKTLDGQQKEFLLRERMKAIKEELGEISSKDTEIEDWKKTLEDKKYPGEVRAKALEEIKKYESTPPISAEANVIKSYIELIIKLPWKTFTVDNEDIQKTKHVLDKYHYGLKKVKERILEYLAVKINTKNSHAPIITLLGPPGVGKTSLARSIGEAIGREVIKVSLGGLRDEAEIRGHRRTYVGAMPGKIIQAVKKAQTSNPVILLDEIDKMSSDYKGDPTSAMLEVLDPEQNRKFQDHYLELEYDLSQVMFIATANYLENIPAPLIDRVEIIRLNQYSSEEKLEIAKQHIIPRTIMENGLTKKQFNISDRTIEYVIDKYTQEAGVRELQRIMSKLARKVVVKKLEGKVQEEFHVNQQVVTEFLGQETVYKEKLKGRAEVGLVNGMYYSAVGGGLLPIEVTTYPTKNGEIKLTGSIRDVMKESLNIAIGYIRANSKRFGINFDFEKNTIQVHVPEGAMPKDGPSAGIAFATAVISALLNKPIDKDIALTGEITLRGKILPIGGLKEKSLGAVEAGVKRIFIPRFNQKDTEDLAKKVRQYAQIIPVENYNEVFEHIFSS
ncbi:MULTISPECIES: endopeptidase La [unclassified Mycoplasma]|uniref:endopeptidase La n=1 Tax=unclassified Mycoplasma TaxID=2683645 RepID=UPI000FDF5B39